MVAHDLCLVWLHIEGHICPLGAWAKENVLFSCISGFKVTLKIVVGDFVCDIFCVCRLGKEGRSESLPSLITKPMPLIGLCLILLSFCDFLCCYLSKMGELLLLYMLCFFRS